MADAATDGSDLVVYGLNPSQPVRALRIFLDSNNVAYEFKNLDLFKGEHMTEEFLKINPLHTVPAIEHNEYTLAESEAIFRYVINSFATDDHWYPKDLHKRGKVDEYLCWHHGNTRIKTTEYFRSEAFPHMLNLPIDHDKIASAKAAFHEMLKTLEKVFLGDGTYKYLNNLEDVTIADLLMSQEIEQVLALGFSDLLADHKVIQDYMDHIKSKLNPLYEQYSKAIWDACEPLRNQRTAL